jgi:hypothetical protein
MFTLLLIFLGLASVITQGSRVTHNVIFQKTGDISLTKSRWLVTFVLPLSPYEEMIARMFMELDDVVTVTEKVLTKYTTSSNRAFMVNFKTLNEELQIMRDTFVGMIQSYAQYQELSNRPKRALLPLLGDALHWLFGTVTDSDLEAVQKNVEQLSRNQQKLKHIMEDSLTFIQANRAHINENRQTINGLIDGLKEVNNKLTTFQQVEKDIFYFKALVSAYFQVNVVMNEIKQVMQRVNNGMMQ